MVEPMEAHQASGSAAKNWLRAQERCLTSKTPDERGSLKCAEDASNLHPPTVDQAHQSAQDGKEVPELLPT